mmetsp:Transcript_1419/g.2269  ORF Transcript_1419/g.2269 Transcript_1419/m.2269 type:complete len:260 (+) Transcript_1419:136-915(+)
MFENSTTTQRNVTKKLSTGHTIYLTTQEDRMLKRVYDYLAGYAQRMVHIQKIENKKAEVVKNAGVIAASKGLPSTDSNVILKSYKHDQRTQLEIQTDAMFQLKDELQDLEDKFKAFEAQKHTIGFKDIDVVLRKLGAAMHKKNIEFMIWEVDEQGDGVIDWDEFQLTYYRNIVDESGCEPCTFFHVLEFLTFDENNKGYIIEDDCMEILFARHGSSKLEKELQFLFGNQLRAAGGTGTLSLSEYLAATMGRTGRRAVVP